MPLRLDFLYPTISNEELVLVSNFDVQDADSLPDLSEVARDEIDGFCPFDELLGRRVDMLDAINDPRLSPHQRDLFLGALSQIPTTRRSKLTDDELIALVPSRYNASMVDDAKFASYLRDIVDSEASSAAESGSDSEEPAPAPDASAAD